MIWRVHLGQGGTRGRVLQRVPRFSREYAARNGNSERMSVVYRCRTDEILQGRGVDGTAHCARSTLGPAPLGHRLAANVAEWTGQGETGHILHQRCVWCDPLQARTVAEGTAFSCCVFLTQPVNKGLQGNLQATFFCTVPESRQRKSCSRGTFACPKVAGERLRWYPVHDRNFGVPSMSENRDVSRPGAANRPGTAR